MKASELIHPDESLTAGAPSVFTVHTKDQEGKLVHVEDMKVRKLFKHFLVPRDTIFPFQNSFYEVANLVIIRFGILFFLFTEEEEFHSRFAKLYLLQSIV